MGQHVGGLEASASNSIIMRTSLRFLFCEGVEKWIKIELTRLGAGIEGHVVVWFG